MPEAQIDPTLPETAAAAAAAPACSPSRPVPEGSRRRRFVDLRGVQWRIDLGILPADDGDASTSSVDDLRRVTANSRRRYATLRRRLLVDPHIPKEGSNSPNLVMDNPLSQNPDSMWGRFFRSAELERMVDQDLSRLYPEHGSYFQTTECQAMLRRILLLWCLRHPEYGYRQGNFHYFIFLIQVYVKGNVYPFLSHGTPFFGNSTDTSFPALSTGMHELLAPLLYVLHVDVEYLSEVRKQYEDHFTDQFDGFAFHESDLTYKFDFMKFSESTDDEIGPQKTPVTVLNELDPKIQAIVLLSDAYGPEGELGIVLSEKFMEHDAYCMFDALMNGAGGAVAMAEFFSFSPLGGPHTGLPPVIEASSALYHLLSIVDASLYSHLVELGVEPQYFALRWLRVLFGREFALEDLLLVWDEIFASDNSKIKRCAETDMTSSFGVLNSSRGAFISALAVAMILHLRSSLLATENATSCLQRLLNFPEDISQEKLIAKAKSLQALALDANISAPLPTHTGAYDRSKPVAVRGHSLSSDAISPGSPLSVVPDSYWEEKWRVLHKEAACKHGSAEKQGQNRIKGWSEKVRLRLSRTESDPSPSKAGSRKRDPRPSVRRSLLDDLARQLGSEEDTEEIVSGEDLDLKNSDEVDGRDEERRLSGNAGSEENSSIFSDPPSPVGGGNNDHENDSERSSVASNLSVDENEAEESNVGSSRDNQEALPLPISDSPEDTSVKGEQSDDSTGNSAANFKERKPLSGKFQWFWKFGRNGGEGISERGGAVEATKTSNSGHNQNTAGSSTADGSNSSSVNAKGDAVDQNVMVSLRNIGHSMLENIQVIESVFQQERGQAGTMENYSKNALVGRGQVTAMAALKELRKISNLLSEM
ncbi:hypothetical protein RJ639_033218 [Escallonia herrerae]|uniref:Rab-GAP TBC domain-containing protein n=1 Tax=Escallonia herrerae TaxID=1293975 RepID=A0AA89BE14_9ASTE|nr:hypothetical protein RJ639_033218 [Escallonia herrerae]